MKDCEKKWQLNRKESVIATLMGFDHELRPQQPIREKRRVLSESYVRKAASIGIRPGSLLSNRCSNHTKNGNVHCLNDNLLDKVKKGIRSPKPADASVSKSLTRVSREERTSCVLRYMQKLEHDMPTGHIGEHGINYMTKSLNSQLEMIGKPRVFSTSFSVFKPKSVKAIDDPEDVHSRRGCREHREFLRPESGIMSTGHGCIACTRTMNSISQQERPRSKFVEVPKPGYMGENYVVNDVEALMPSFATANDYKNDSHDTHLLLDQSSLINESKRQSFRNWRTKVQEGISRLHQTLDEMLALADKKSMLRNLNMGLGRNGVWSPSSLQSRSSGSSSSVGVSEDDYLKSSPFSQFELIKETLTSARDNKSKEQTVSQKDILEPKGGRAYENSETSLGVYDTAQSISDVTYASAEAFNGGICSTINGDYVQKVLHKEASSNEFSEEDATYSNCSLVSPDSVLEPFDVQNSSTFECFDSIGLQLQLQALHFDSEETYSEGSAMAVSDDEDTEKQLDDLSHDGRKVKMWLGGGQSRNFSYLVDVLDEAGFCGMNSPMDLKSWYSLECPISPLVFNVVEKKYGKQTSWHKSERQLLFDQINSGLTSIFNPLVNLPASVRRRFCTSLKHDDVEDELWTILISQEKETSKDLFEKASEKWLQHEEGVNIICTEMETTLFDELVMELTSFW